ncbi:MAG: GNAT family N-acetyltransferase [Oscillospiraceae bacterium]
MKGIFVKMIENNAALKTLAQAKQLLMRDAQKNAYALLRIRQNAVTECAVFETAVRLLDGESNKYLYAFDTMEQFDVLYKQVALREGSLVSFSPDVRFESALRAYDSRFLVTAYVQLCTAPRPRQIEDESLLPDISIGEVSKDMAQWMLSVYEHPEMSDAFIRRRIASAPNAAAFYKGRPIAFFITHSEAEMGPVYIDPDFRGHGISTALYNHVLHQFSVQGLEPPIAFVHPENSASLGWLARMGCTPSREQILWFWRE